MLKGGKVGVVVGVAVPVGVAVVVGVEVGVSVGVAVPVLVGVAVGISVGVFVGVAVVVGVEVGVSVGVFVGVGVVVWVGVEFKRGWKSVNATAVEPTSAGGFGSAGLGTLDPLTEDVKKRELSALSPSHFEVLVSLNRALGDRPIANTQRAKHMGTEISFFMVAPFLNLERKFCNHFLEQVWMTCFRNKPNNVR